MKPKDGWLDDHLSGAHKLGLAAWEETDRPFRVSGS